MSSKVATMRDAVAELVRDGDTVAIEGFTHLISFAAGHEIIRQRRRDLTLARMTPDLIYDQMIAAGVARKLVFSWLGNPGVGGLNAIRRVTEGATRDPRARGVQPLRDGRPLHGGRREPALLPAAELLRDRPAEGEPADPADRVARTATGRSTRCPRCGPTSRSSTPSGPTPPATPRSGASLGCQKEAAFAAERVIVVVEELVEEAVIRADPNRTIIPGIVVDAVVVEPWGAHPSLRPGSLRPRQPLLPRLGSDHPRRGRDGGMAAGVGLRPRRSGGLRGEARDRAPRVAPAVRRGSVRRRRLRGVPLMAEPQGGAPALRRPRSRSPR